MPAIISFLGYDPLPRPTTWAELFFGVSMHAGLGVVKKTNDVVCVAEQFGFAIELEDVNVALKEQLLQ